MNEIAYREGFPAAHFLALAQRVWPRDYSAADTEAALERTVNLGAWDGARLVGSVRLLTDGYLYAIVPESLVDPAHQRRGIGEELMRCVVARAPRGKLACAAQSQSAGFFQRIGCEQRLTSFVAVAPLGPDRAT